MIDVACEWSLVTAPAEEPLTLAEAKQHCRIDVDDDNAILASYITAARLAAEQYLNRALFTQTWQTQLSEFADVIWLPMAAPLQSVSSVKYYDTSGVLQTLATSYYIVDTTSEPGRVVRAPNQSWPGVQADRLAPVVITYVCGWAAVGDIPELIKAGMRLTIEAQNADFHGGDSAATMKAARACWDLCGSVFWRPPTPCWS